MSTNPYVTRILDNLRVRLPGALDTALKLELFNVLNEFLKKSNAWQEDILVDVKPGVTDYPIEPADGVINRVMQVVNSAGINVRATFAVPPDLILEVAPVQNDTLTVTVSLTVADTDRDEFPVFPDWMFSNYYDDFIDGALGRMMSQPAKPYSNERLSIYHLRRFHNAVARAKAEIQHGNLYSAQSWRYPAFASGRQR
ncbi:MAG TPA: hypothetical protein VKT73_15135 [Xanthobacteraceae bacterium]|nr:hypothetical protein [Xanthobacteraceae bacterium]